MLKSSVRTAVVQLDEAIKCLRTYIDPRRARSEFEVVDARLRRSTWVLEQWRKSLLSTPSSLTVAVIGEFNSGKSTLINAMIGDQVAFVDAFESTSVIAVYIRDPGPPHAILFAEDGAQREKCTIQEFVGISMRGGGELVRAEVHVDHSLPYRLVDTCGLATITERNEILTHAAIMESDVLVWVMNPEDLLGSEESQYIKRCRSIGMPLVVVLGKSDTIPPTERHRIVEGIATRLGMSPDDILPVSARTHTTASPDDGVIRLLGLLDARAADASGTRKEVLRARVQESESESRRAMAELREHVARGLGALDSERAVLELDANAVCVKALTDCTRQVCDALLGALLPRYGKTLPIHDIEALCLECGEHINAQVDRARASVQDLVARVVPRAWSTLIEEHIDDVRRQIVAIEREPTRHNESIQHLRDRVSQLVSRKTIIELSALGLVKKGAWVAAGLLASTKTGNLHFLKQAVLHAAASSATRTREVEYVDGRIAIATICHTVVPEAVERSIGPLVREFCSAIVDAGVRETAHRAIGVEDALLRQCASEMEMWDRTYPAMKLGDA